MSTAVRRRRRRVHAVGTFVLGEGGFIAITVAVSRRPAARSSAGDLRAWFLDDPATALRTPPISSAGPRDTLYAEGVTDTIASPTIRSTVGRWVSEKYRRRPMIVPTVLAVRATDFNPTNRPRHHKLDAGAHRGFYDEPSRRCRRSSFPVDVLGRAPTTSTSRGCLDRRRARQNLDQTRLRDRAPSSRCLRSIKRTTLKAFALSAIVLRDRDHRGIADSGCEENPLDLMATPCTPGGIDHVGAAVDHMQPRHPGEPTSPVCNSPRPAPRPWQPGCPNTG